MVTQDILSAIPWGILMAFTVGPVFFVLIETSVIKGIRAGIFFNMGVATSDILFILIAYFSTNKILEKLKDDPILIVFGGILLLGYGIVSYITSKRDFKKIPTEALEKTNLKKNYHHLFLKGFLLNFINMGVLGFWLGIIIFFRSKRSMEPDRMALFLATILVTYLVIDFVKIVLAKQLKRKLTSYSIFRVKRVISVILIVFGSILIIQRLFPEEKEKIKTSIKYFKRK